MKYKYVQLQPFEADPGMTTIFCGSGSHPAIFIRSRCRKVHLLPPFIKPFADIQLMKYKYVQRQPFDAAPVMTIIFCGSGSHPAIFIRSRCRKGHLLPPFIKPFAGIQLMKYKYVQLQPFEADPGMTIIFCGSGPLPAIFIRSRCRKGHLLPLFIKPFAVIQLMKYKYVQLQPFDAAPGMTTIFCGSGSHPAIFIRSRYRKRHLLQPVIKSFAGIQLMKYKYVQLQPFEADPGMTTIFCGSGSHTAIFIRSRCRKGHLLPPVIKSFAGIQLMKYKYVQRQPFRSSSGHDNHFLWERAPARDFYQEQVPQGTPAPACY